MRHKMIIWTGLIFYLGIFICAHADDFPEVVREKSAESGSPAFSGPFAVVKESNFNFKSILEGTIVIHDFIIENTGNALLKIIKVNTICGCTTADYTKEIPPGATGSITLSCNSAGYAGKIFSKTIIVYTNDAKQREITLVIEGEVTPLALTD
ncbi:conserved hypothetical protein [uncultured Desulfobacterium sp.]|uniref:DUF1573 domain-containing protein n=1 Tax=uncultured Desulfobacterium sp. TaxID=201089 RepID=A0A445N0P6_9BACT|nr:conserved hypothetical protein [uncultured Desulfobacterium sp.]